MLMRRFVRVMYKLEVIKIIYLLLPTSWTNSFKSLVFTLIFHVGLRPYLTCCLFRTFFSHRTDFLIKTRSNLFTKNENTHEDCDSALMSLIKLYEVPANDERNAPCSSDHVWNFQSEKRGFNDLLSKIHVIRAKIN